MIKKIVPISIIIFFIPQLLVSEDLPGECLLPNYLCIASDWEPLLDLNKDNQWNPDELYIDVNGDGEYNDGEPYTDSNGNGEYDSAEYFGDLDGNGTWSQRDNSEPYSDSDGNGIYTEGEEFVDENGDGVWSEFKFQFHTISEAIDSSITGDTLLIADGLYIENLYIDKDITLLSFYFIDGDTIHHNNAIIDGRNGVEGNTDMGSTVIFYQPDRRDIISPAMNGFTLTNGFGTLITMLPPEPDEPAESGLAGGQILTVNCSFSAMDNTFIGSGIGVGRGASKNYGGQGASFIGSGIGVGRMTRSEVSRAVEYYYSPENRSRAYSGNMTGSRFIGSGIGVGRGSSSSAGRSYFIGSGIGVGRDDDDMTMNMSNSRFPVAFIGSGIGVGRDEDSTIVGVSEYFCGTNSEDDSTYIFTGVTSSVSAIHADSLSDGQVYVSPSIGTDTEGSGLTSNTPFKTIDYALSRVYGTPVTPVIIKLLPGTYSPPNETFPIIMVENVHIDGSGSDNTILNAQGSDRVILFENAINSQLKNVKIIGGNTNSDDYELGGAGIYVKYGSPFLKNLVIENNISKHFGAGISLNYNVDIVLKNVLIRNNTGNLSGNNPCAFYADLQSNPVFKDVVIASNNDIESAIFLYGGSGAKFIGTKILLNDGYGAKIDGIYHSSNPKFINCSIADNDNGINIYRDSHVNITNSIIWGNNNGAEQINLEDHAVPSTVEISFSDIQGGFSGINTNSTGEFTWLGEPYTDENENGYWDVDESYIDLDGDNTWDGLLDANPGFFTNYDISDSSPCKDEGNPHKIYRDFDGTRNDIGATGGSYLDENSSYFNLGEVVVNTTRPFEWIISNFKSTTVTINEITIGNFESAFNIVTPIPLEIEPYESGTIIIEFTPEIEGSMQSTIMITSNEFPGNGTVLLPVTSSVVGGYTVFTEDIIDADTTLSIPETGTYLINNDVHVNAGVTLTIEEGVNIEFDGKYTITVAGALIAEGSEDSYITFRKYQQSVGGGIENWGGIVLDNADSNSSISYTVIQNAKSDYGGGLSIINCDPTIDNVIFQYNEAIEFGGGIYLNNSNAILTNILLENNTAASGGGLMMVNSSPIIRDLKFIGNTASSGGGIYSYGSSPDIDGAIFFDNIAFYAGGGGLKTRFCGSAFKFSNGLFVGNTAQWGSAMEIRDESTPVFENLTMYDQGQTGTIPGAVYIWSNAHPEMINSILWDEGIPEIVLSEVGIDSGAVNNITLSFSDIQDGNAGISVLGTSPFVWDDVTNINSDPLFDDASSGNFNLSEVSPCIGTGLDGVNMGASGVIPTGCTDTFATNFDPGAITEDGSCTYGGISINPVEISDSLWSGGLTSQTVTISNTGDGELIWDMSFTHGILGDWLMEIDWGCNLFSDGDAIVTFYNDGSLIIFVEVESDGEIVQNYYWGNWELDRDELTMTMTGEFDEFPVIITFIGIVDNNSITGNVDYYLATDPPTFMLDGCWEANRIENDEVALTPGVGLKPEFSDNTEFQNGTAEFSEKDMMGTSTKIRNNKMVTYYSVEEEDIIGISTNQIEGDIFVPDFSRIESNDLITRDVEELNILVYDDFPYPNGADSPITVALDSLGYNTYTQTFIPESFTDALTEPLSNWDLVIYSCYYYFHDENTYDEILEYVENGGKLIFSDWQVFSYAAHPLFNLLGVSFQSDFITPKNLDVTGLLTNIKNDIGELNWSNDPFYRDGQIMNVLAGAMQYGGFDGFPTAGAIVSNSENKTIFNAFQISNYGYDGDNDQKIDILELLENEIELLIGGAGDIWISTSSNGGVIPVGGSSEVTLSMDASGLEIGFFISNLYISSNDVDNPFSVIPVSLEVTASSCDDPLAANYAPENTGCGGQCDGDPYCCCTYADVAVGVTEITIEMTPTQMTGSQMLAISNNGDGDLNFTLATNAEEDITPPETGADSSLVGIWQVSIDFMCTGSAEEQALFELYGDGTFVDPYCQGGVWSADSGYVELDMTLCGILFTGSYTETSMSGTFAPYGAPPEESSCWSAVQFEGGGIGDCMAEAPYSDSCYDYVIEIDTYCCNIEWDEICEEEYMDCIEDDPGGGGPGGEECVYAPYSDECYDIVISINPYCCNETWDGMCEDEYWGCMGGGPGGGGCVEAPYSDDCYDYVTMLYPSCCDMYWDDICDSEYWMCMGGDSGGSSGITRRNREIEFDFYLNDNTIGDREPMQNNYISRRQLTDNGQISNEDINRDEPIFSWDMEGDLSGWSTVVYTSDDLWHTVNTEYQSAYTSWWCGSESTGNYETGNIISTAVVSPTIDLTDYSEVSLEFWENFETEWGWDFCMVDVSTDGGTNWIPLRGGIGSAPSGNTYGWVLTSLDLTPFSGNEVNIRFYFDTGDEWMNAFPGWYFDDVAIYENSLSATWLSFSTYNGSVAPGENIEVEVFFDRSSLDFGSYEADIFLASNDPNEPLITIPAEMTIFNAPEAWVSTESISELLGNGEESFHEIIVSNQGGAPLEWSIIPPLSPWLTLSQYSPLSAPGSNDDRLSEQMVVSNLDYLRKQNFYGLENIIEISGESVSKFQLINNQKARNPLREKTNQDSFTGEYDARDDDDEGPSILILHTYGEGMINEWAEELNTENITEWMFSTPDIEMLLDFDIVIAGSNYAWEEPDAVGDVLAQYVDLGGNLIMLGATFNTGGNWAIGGAIQDSLYNPLSPSSYSCCSEWNNLNFASISDHPINNNVDELSTRLFANTSVQSWGTSLGIYENPSSSGDPIPFGAFNPDKHIVALNVFGVGEEGDWWAGDLGRLLNNSIGWMFSESLAGVIPPFQETSIQVRINAAGIPGGEYYDEIVLITNDPQNSINNIPVSLTVMGTAEMIIDQSYIAETLNMGESSSNPVLITNNGGLPLDFYVEILFDIDRSNIDYEDNSETGSATLNDKRRILENRQSFNGVFNTDNSESLNEYYESQLDRDEPIFVDEMENGVNGWTTVNYMADDFWHITERNFNTESHSWWCGNEEWGHYGSGQTISNALISPEIDLTGIESTIMLSFFENYSTEPGWDFCMVDVSNDGGNSWVSLRGGIGEAPSGESNGWNHTVLELTEFANDTIQIRYYFDTGDGLYNDYPGWYIDDVVVTTGDSRWLIVAPEFGNISPGGSMQLDVQLNAEGLNTGDYFADMIINSNDPGVPEYTLPISLTVNSLSQPDITVYGTDFNQVLNQGETTSQIFSISNEGEGNLEWDISISTSTMDSILFEDNSYSRPIEPLYVPNGRTTDVGKSEVEVLMLNPAVNPEDYDNTRDAFGYIVDDNVQFDWIEPTNETEIDLGDDDSQWANIGFDMPFYENAFSQVNISSNGWLSFTLDYFWGGYIWSEWLPSSNAPENVIAIYALDGYPTGSCYYFNDENGNFVVTWEDWGYYGDFEEQYSMQAILSPNGDIKLQYKDVELTATEFNGGWKTVGIQDAFQSDGITYIGPFDGNDIENEMAVKFILSSTLNWVYADIDAGVIAPYSMQNIELFYDASGLIGGDYFANLTIFSNDLDEPILDFSVSLTVSEQYPVISWYPSMLMEEVPVGEILVQPITIENWGEGDLNWQIVVLANDTTNFQSGSQSSNIHRLNTLMNPVETDYTLISSDSGNPYADENNRLNEKTQYSSWKQISNFEGNDQTDENQNREITILDFEDGENLGVNLGGSMTWNNQGGGHLYCEMYDNDDFIFFDAPMFVSSFEMNFNPWEDYESYGGPFQDINAYDPDGNIIWSTTVDLSDFTDWDDWLTVFVETGNIMALEFVAPGNAPYFSGFWPSIDNLVIDDESFFSWINVTEQFGILPPGSSHDVGVILDASQIEAGFYNANLVIISNDLTNPNVVIPVSMTATASLPEITVTPGAMSMVLNSWETSSQTMNIQNTGEGDLNWQLSISTMDSLLGEGNSFTRPIEPLYVPNGRMADIGKSEIEILMLNPNVNPDDYDNTRDAFGYFVDDSAAFEWINPIDETVVDLGDDDAQWVDIGFDMPFYDNIFSEISISSNGWLAFTLDNFWGGHIWSEWLPSNYAPENVIAVYALDGYPTGSCYYFNDENGNFVITWENWGYFGDFEEQYDMQAILYPNGNIKLQYKEIGLTATEFNGGWKTVGIQNSNRTDGITYLGPWDENDITNNLAVKFVLEETVNWIYSDMTSGVVPQFSSQDIEIYFDASGLNGGTYFADIIISSNDLDEPFLSIPIDMTVSTGYPELSGVPVEMSIELDLGDSDIQSFTLCNDGDGILEYGLSVTEGELDSIGRNIGFYAEDRYSQSNRRRQIGQSPDEYIEDGNRDIGDIIGEYWSPNPGGATGMAWVNGELYVVSYEFNELRKIDPFLGDVIDAYPIHYGAYGIAWDGQYFWIGDYTGNIFAYDIDGNQVGSFSTPAPSFLAIAFDGTNFIVTSPWEINPTIYKVDYTGEVLASYSTEIDDYITQITWVPEHIGGNLWAVTENNGTVWQLTTEGDQIEIMNSFTIPTSNARYAVGHNHQNLWVVDFNGPYIEIDDGIIEFDLAWLTLSETFGELFPNECNNIEVFFNAVDPGEFNGGITIFSNDPDESMVSFPVSMMVNLYGCIDPAACNFNPMANLDDGSCTFPETYYDCEGNCLNDSDGDGLCDEQELPEIPTAVTAIGGNNEITVSWDASFFFSNQDDVTSKPISKSGVLQSSADVYSINSVDSDYLSWMNEINGSRNLNYDDVDRDFIFYFIYRDGVIVGEGITENSYFDSGLDFLESHCYSIIALNDIGFSDMSDESCATTNDCAGNPFGEENASITNFCEDTDGDGLGNPGTDTELCDGLVGDGWVEDCTDTEPDCVSNDTDDCEVCGGENLDMDCAGICFGEALILTYCEDTDGDGLGNPDSVTDFCDALVDEGWVEDCTDPEPDCITNDTDSFGICSGDNTIQGAVDAVNEGDTVTVPGGTYVELISITKSLTLECNAGESCIINVEAMTYGIEVNASNVIVSGFEIMGDDSTVYGMVIRPGSINVTLSDNIIHGMALANPSNDSPLAYGILVYGNNPDDMPNEIYITNNDIYNVLGSGISLGSYTNNIHIEENNIYDIIPVDYYSEQFSIGIQAQLSGELFIEGNEFTNLVIASNLLFTEGIVTGNQYSNVSSFLTATENSDINFIEDVLWWLAQTTIVVDEIPIVLISYASSLDNAILVADDGSVIYTPDGEEIVQDCAGIWDGVAFENECGCVDGSTGIDPEFCFGCTDPTALNYDPDATADDGSCEFCPLGDANQDCSLDVLDIVLIIDFILQPELHTPEEILLGDVNGDENTNILDVVMIIEWILNGVSRIAYEHPVHNAELVLSSNSMSIESDGIVAGIQLSYNGDISISEIFLPEGWEIHLSDQTLIIISMNGSFLENTKLIEFTGDFQIESNIIADWNGNGVTASVEIIPDQFELNPAYPNPFNPITTIGYSLPEDCTVEIQIFDMMGQEVATLVGEHKNAGNHTIQWNANGYSTGLYFVSMKTESYQKTQKILLIK